MKRFNLIRSEKSKRGFSKKRLLRYSSFILATVLGLVLINQGVLKVFQTWNHLHLKTQIQSCKSI